MVAPGTSAQSMRTIVPGTVVPGERLDPGESDPGIDGARAPEFVLELDPLAEPEPDEEDDPELDCRCGVEK